MKSGFTTTILSKKKPEWGQVNRQNRHQDETFTAISLCCVFGGTSKCAILRVASTERNCDSWTISEQIIVLSRALQDKRPGWAEGHTNVTLLDARPHVAKIVKESFELLGWEVLPDPFYSPHGAYRCRAVSKSSTWKITLKPKIQLTGGWSGIN